MAMYTQSQIATLAASVGFKDTNMASSIAMAESGGDTAIGPNASGDVGLWQINIPAHPQYTIAQMKDPILNAQAAYAISNGGTSWRLWCTAWSDGACGKRGGSYLGSGSPYQKFLGGKTGGTQVVTIPEWTKPFMAMSVQEAESRTNHYPTSAEGWAEGGVDWTPQPNNLPITALLDGVIVGAGYFCKDGSSNQFFRSTYQGCSGAQGYGVVTILSNNPYPNIVSGSQIQIYYQHIIIANNIKLSNTGGVGQTVKQGDTIGYANGSFNVEVGINIGSEWGGIWGPKSPGPHVDPIPYLNKLISSGVNAGAGSAIGTSTGAAAAAQVIKTNIETVSRAAYEKINHLDGFIGICETLDLAETFVPFYLPTAAQQDINAINQPQTINVFGFNTGVTNPIAATQSTQAALQLPADSIQAILVFTVTNFEAFAVRLMFVSIGLVLGVALIINAISSMVDIKDVGQIAGMALAA